MKLQIDHYVQNPYLYVFFAATALFSLHSSTVLRRFFKHEMIKMRREIYNQSLPMPLVSLSLESERRFNNNLPFAEMRFEPYFNRQPLDSWEYTIYQYGYSETLVNGIDVNAVPEEEFEHAKALSRWPIRTEYITVNRRISAPERFLQKNFLIQITAFP